MKHILVIDDSETVRRFHSDVLKCSGFRVTTATDGADGLEKLFSSPCDLVLTDINMPGMDGYEFSQRVRKEKQFNHVPIIIVSTEAEDRDKIRGFAAGANLYMVKPVDPELMLEQIQLILGQA